MDGIEGMCLPDAETLCANSDVIVVSHATDEFRKAIAARRPGQPVIDLARLYKTLPEGDAGYQGIAW
jgi:hypothetical protein